MEITQCKSPPQNAEASDSCCLETFKKEKDNFTMEFCTLGQITLIQLYSATSEGHHATPGQTKCCYKDLVVWNGYME